ncbi:hypothetical protein ACO22_06958 [Paracoccidioides brasiliensis]|uniref:SEC7 domain-containing protein n=1 Tax=Paracoccidioides brasiliensis TaxID=121759 RepID=A0A1D2J618_PARBR|nr:hypothetical protein ACO22_06958 [Paracoccidioides brasiliensis]
MTYEYSRTSKRAMSAFPSSSSRAPQMYDASSGESPPRTPPSCSNNDYKTVRKENLTVLAPRRETFLDDITPADNNHHTHHHPDSGDEDYDTHDLSLSPKHVTRTSVVDNMLLSLDQFSVGDPLDSSRLFGTSSDPEPHTIYTRYSSTRSSRPRGHTFSSSLSSDVEAHSEDNSGRYSSQSIRGRRSNSSSNYHPGLRRIDSVRGGGDRVKVYDAQRAVTYADRPPTNRTSRLRTKGSSRSSGSSSLDFNQMMATSRPGQHFRERRSASFDCGSRLPPSLPLVDSLGGFDDFVHDNGFPYDDIDAAPTPTVPAGPRRNNSPPLREFPYTQTFPTSMRTPALARKNSSKSARSMHIKKGRSDTLGTATIRGHGYSSRPYRGPIPDFHPIPSYNNLQPAPSPTVAFHKSSYLAPQPVVNTPSPAPKERPGFFRRVFGGGSSKSQTQTQSESQSPCSQQENGSPRRPQEQYQSAITPNLSKGQKQLLQKEHAISTGNNNTSSRENTPVITKKPSSFFRRRKKSITDHVPPPLILPQSNIRTAAVDTNFLKPDPLKLDHCQAVGLGGPEPSPVSSLRRVMKPYLNAPYLVDDDTNLDDADNEVSGSEMLLSAADTMRSATTAATTNMNKIDSSKERSLTQVTNPSYLDTNKDNSSDNNPHSKNPRNGSSINSKPGLNLNLPSHDREDSFLEDSIGKEGNSPANPNSNERSGSGRPMTSPNAQSHMKSMMTKNSQDSMNGGLKTFGTNGKATSSATGSGSGSRASHAVSHQQPQQQHTPSLQSKHSAIDEISAAMTNSASMQCLSDNENSHAHPRRQLQSDENDWFENDSSVEAPNNRVNRPGEGNSISPRASLSTVSNYHTALNTPSIPDDDATVRRSKPPTLPPLQMEIHTEHEHELKRDDGKVDIDNIINDDDNDGEDEGDTTILASNSVSGEPSEVDRAQAQRIFDEAEDYRDRHDKEPAAAWLGNPGRAMVRKAYMELFDWRNVNILMALRGLCGRLTLKGETQQVDRILDAFSSRWCECNEEHGFMATDVVHTICYSLLLLNTDLHIADIEQKMTRSQFIKNTMPTIQRVVSDARPKAFERSHLGNLSSKPRTVVRASGTASALAGKSPTLPPVQHKGHGSLDINVPSSNLSKPVDATARTNSMCTISTNLNAEVSSADAGPLVSTPFRGTQRAWEVQIESVLKDFYNSIQKQMLPLRGAPAETEEYNHQQHSSNFLTLTGNMLRRTPSTLSKSGSDVCQRGRTNENRLSTVRWSSKPRSRPRMYPTSNIGSSRTSLDEQSSLWSPSASSTWSKHSLPKTILSMSVDSFGPEYPRGDYQQSIGFANALSHAIIREDSANANAMAGMDDPARAASLLDDETLELAGAPWAKEGSLKHKHHLDSVDKRSKDRNWNESFAVIQRGWMRLFSFNASTKSMRVKSKNRQNGSGSGGLVVGGGNWTENAEETWKFLLRQTIASALPSPGYSKSRPHVWALSLPTGAVHLFQVGTPEIVKEFVSSANYWSARLSKEPLFGGISNIEYGWSAAVINTALIQNSSDPSSPPPTTTTTTTSSSAPRPSFQSSLRTSLDQQSGAHGSVRARLPADRIHIADWTPPQQSMMASTLTEAEQLNTLRRYVKHVEEELQRHNELRSAMVLAFTPRHPNAGKAMANWERKSSYLLREIVKFRTYIDCLVLAGGLREGMKRGGGKGSGVVVPLAVELEGGGEEVKAKAKAAMPTVRRVETDGSSPFERSRTMSFSAAS